MADAYEEMKKRVTARKNALDRVSNASTNLENARHEVDRLTSMKNEAISKLANAEREYEIARENALALLPAKL